MKPGVDITGPLTAAQSDHLTRLIEAAAIDKASAVSAFDRRVAGGLNPMVIGRLVDLGLAEKAVRRPRGGSQHTVYWLTPDGAGIVRRRLAA